MRDVNHEARRAVIREWMALPKDKRASQQQAAAFAAKAGERHAMKGPRDPSEQMMGWLLPRVGKA